MSNSIMELPRNVPIIFKIEDLNYGPMKTQFVCGECKEDFYKKEVLQCKNGHHFCSGCWKKNLKKENKCMNCSVECEYDNLSKCSYIEKEFNDQNVDCPYSFLNILQNKLINDQFFQLVKDSDACTDEVLIKDLEKHLKSCEFRLVHCKNFQNGCPDVMRIKEYEDHIKLCKYEEMSCIHCNIKLIKKNFIEHYEKCENVTINCVQCKKELKRGEMNCHIHTECLNTLISCKFKSSGCQEVVKRCEMKTHMQENHNIEILNSLELYSIQIKDLNERFQSQSRLIGNLNFCSSLENFNQLKDQINETQNNVELFKSQISSDIKDTNEYWGRRLSNHEEIFKKFLEDKEDLKIQIRNSTKMLHQILNCRDNETNKRCEELLERHNKMESSIDTIFNSITDGEISNTINDLNRQVYRLHSENEKKSTLINQLFDKLETFELREKKNNDFFLKRIDDMSYSIKQLLSLNDQWTFTNKWTIKNFSQLLKKKNGEYITSSIFNFGPYKFEWTLYPRGDTVRADQNISIFLYNRNSENIKLNYSAKLVNHKNDSNSVKKCIDETELKSGAGWGFNKFINSYEIDCQNGWLSNDTLTLRFTISIKTFNQIQPLET